MPGQQELLAQQAGIEAIARQPTEAEVASFREQYDVDPARIVQRLATLTPAADGTSSPAPSKVVARPTPEDALADLIALVSQLSNDDVRVLRRLAVALQDRD